MTDFNAEILCRFRRSDPTLDSVIIEFYPDGTPLIRERRVPHAILLRPRSLDAFMAAMMWVDAMHDRGFSAPHLLLPHVPGGRQDRLNDEGDVLFSAKSIAGIINARTFPSVCVLDPHSDVTPALIERCHVAHLPAGLAFSRSEYTGVIAPDGGATRRAQRVAAELKLPLFHGWKTREVDGGKISAFGLQTLPVVGCYLIVDDICDAGGTFLGLAAQIQAQQCTAHLFVTHGLFSKGTGLLVNAFPSVMCTDSIVGDKPDVLTMDYCKQLLTEIA